AVLAENSAWRLLQLRVVESNKPGSRSKRSDRAIARARASAGQLLSKPLGFGDVKAIGAFGSGKSTYIALRKLRALLHSSTSTATRRGRSRCSKKKPALLRAFFITNHGDGGPIRRRAIRLRQSRS